MFSPFFGSPGHCRLRNFFRPSVHWDLAGAPGLREVHGGVALQKDVVFWLPGAIFLWSFWVVFICFRFRMIQTPP